MGVVVAYSGVVFVSLLDEESAYAMIA